MNNKHVSIFLRKIYFLYGSLKRCTLVSGTCFKVKYGHFRDKNTILHLMYEECNSVFKKKIFAVLIHFAWRIHSAGDIYIMSKGRRRILTNHFWTLRQTEKFYRKLIMGTKKVRIIDTILFRFRPFGFASDSNKLIPTLVWQDEGKGLDFLLLP